MGELVQSSSHSNYHVYFFSLRYAAPHKTSTASQRCPTDPPWRRYHTYSLLLNVVLTHMWAENKTSFILKPQQVLTRWIEIKSGSVNERDFLQSFLGAAGAARLRRSRRDGASHTKRMKLTCGLKVGGVDHVCPLRSRVYHSNDSMTQWDTLMVDLIVTVCNRNKSIANQLISGHQHVRLLRYINCWTFLET